MTTIKPEGLMRSAQKKERIINITTLPDQELDMAAIEFAKSQGYKYSTKPGSDPSDPGGCMSLTTEHQFRLY